MEPQALVLTASCAAALGVSAGLTLRWWPAWQQTWHEFSNLRSRPGTETAHPEPLEALVREPGRLRNSSIIGLYGNALRHTDGAYTRAYHVALEPSLLRADHVLETRCNALARLLAARKPVGTVIQFRLSAGTDAGQALAQHAAARDAAGVLPSAVRLHAGEVATYQTLAGHGLFRQNRLTCWVRVPAPSALAATQRWPALRQELHTRGWAALPGALWQSWQAAGEEQMMRRFADAEQTAWAAAESTLRQFEQACPLALTPLTAEELWAAVYLGHRQKATSIPHLPPLGYDLREYLCGEPLEARGEYVLHGHCPAALVSLFTPPQPTVTADALRLFTFSGTLNFRHTLLSEFVYPDQRRGLKLLDRRLRQVGRATQSLTGRQRFSPEARVALDDLVQLRQDLAGGRAALTQLRLAVVVYGPPARTRAELQASLKQLDAQCEQVIAELRKLPGADAEREAAAATRVLYPRLLVGEASPRPTGREITETASSLAALIPTESEWSGAPRPHTLFSLPTAKLIGFDLFDRQLIPAPLVLALAAPRGGKSVLLARLLTDVLACKAGARVAAVDFGESFGPLVDVLGGRHLRFAPGSDRTLNVWDYEGLAAGILPDEIQVGFVVGDLLQLARVPAHDALAEDILTTLVQEVYRNEVPRNRPGFPKHEPRLAHLVDALQSWPFKGAAANRAEELRLALGQFCQHSFLDAPTHPDFADASPLDVYELDSLEHFPARVREALAYRAAARVLRALGQLQPDGTRAPTLLVFDEVWKLKEKYPRILEVIKRGARTGGKENVVTLLATQAYEDLATLPDLAKTAGVKFIGKQLGDYANLVADCQLALPAAAALSVLHNVPGAHAQFLLVLGAGEDQLVQLVQCDLSPAELWTFTTNPDERNARARVQTLRPAWSLAEVIAWLAAHYPQGLTGAGLVQLDESLLV
jgi:hypothetical protein